MAARRALAPDAVRLMPVYDTPGFLPGGLAASENLDGAKLRSQLNRAAVEDATTPTSTAGDG